MIDLEHLRKAAGAIAALPPPPARTLEVGTRVRDILHANVDRPLHECQPLGALMGIPIVTPEGMDPDVWRLLDGDGNVIQEGTTL